MSRRDVKVKLMYLAVQNVPLAKAKPSSDTPVRRSSSAKLSVGSVRGQCLVATPPALVEAPIITHICKVHPNKALWWACQAGMCRQYHYRHINSLMLAILTLLLERYGLALFCTKGLDADLRGFGWRKLRIKF